MAADVPEWLAVGALVVEVSTNRTGRPTVTHTTVARHTATLVVLANDARYRKVDVMSAVGGAMARPAHAVRYHGSNWDRNRVELHPPGTPYVVEMTAKLDRYRLASRVNSAASAAAHLSRNSRPPSLEDAKAILAEAKTLVRAANLLVASLADES